MMWGLGYGGWGHMGSWIGPIFMVAFWALLIVGGVFLVRFLVRLGREHGTKADSALEILKRRYARGEIGQEEFTSTRKDLN